MAQSGKNHVCTEEAKKFCPNMKMGKGLGKCMMEHRHELSSECLQKFQEKIEDVKVAFRDCSEDVKRLCSHVNKGNGKIIKCLKDHRDELTPLCKSHVKKK